VTIKNLIVAVRGWTNTGDFLLFGRPSGEFPADALEALRAGLPNAEVWAPQLDLTMFNMDDAEVLAKKLFDQIDAKVRSMPALDSIVLLGYSAGSLLVRRVFCMAHGADPDGMVREGKTPPGPVASIGLSSLRESLAAGSTPPPRLPQCDFSRRYCLASRRS
jgi:hypothetical protein